MLPWVMAGKRFAKKNPLPDEYAVFFFFPIYSIGGAEKVNASIVTAFPDKKLLIFFTKKSKDAALLSFFQHPNVTIKDISAFTDNKKKYWKSFFYRGVCAQYINAQKNAPKVFVGQSNFGYKLLPHLKKGIYKVELIHNKVWQFAQVVLPYVPFIDKRIMIADFIKAAYIGYYQRLHYPQRFAERISIIRNGIDVPDSFFPKPEKPQLEIVFVGRGSPEKRLPLLFTLIQNSATQQLPFHFHLAGDFESEIPKTIKNNITWHGIIKDQETMYALHQKTDVCILVSTFEGMPVSLMEGMANSSIPVATAVGGIPEIITHRQNGILIYETEETKIVEEITAALKQIYHNRTLQNELSAQAYLYAKQNFSLEKFKTAYRAALEL